jgi:hypothetical protein
LKHLPRRRVELVRSLVTQEGEGKEGRLTIFALEQVEEIRREVVAELGQGLAQLALVDRAGVVAVEMAEDVLPVLDVFPEACELVFV